MLVEGERGVGRGGGGVGRGGGVLVEGEGGVGRGGGGEVTFQSVDRRTHEY